MSLNTDLTAVFQRVMLTRSSTESETLNEILIRGQHSHAFFAAAQQCSAGSVSDFLSTSQEEIECREPERFVPVSLHSMFPDGQFPVFFYANEGIAFDADEQSQPLSAVYIGSGLVSPDEIGKLSEYTHKTGFVDFEGMLSVGETGYSQRRARPAANREVAFHGTQGEFFAKLDNIACVMPLGMAINVRPAKRLEFESVERADVSTVRQSDGEPVPAEALDSAVMLGEGVLVWKKLEQVQDRYGTVTLLQSTSDERDTVKFRSEGMSGKTGTLIAQIVATRPCPAEADWFRQIWHVAPNEGELIGLGTGTCFFEGDSAVGVKPDQDRDIDWMNPYALHRCSCQSVRLYFLPREKR